MPPSGGLLRTGLKLGSFSQKVSEQPGGAGSRAGRRGQSRRFGAAQEVSWQAAPRDRGEVIKQVLQ